MLYYRYPEMNKDLPGYGSMLTRVTESLNKNWRNTCAYFTRKPVKFDNTHFLKRCADVLDNYQGVSPEDTYANVHLNMDAITKQLGIAYRNNPGEALAIYGDTDAVVAFRWHPEYDHQRLKGDALDSILLPFTHNLACSNHYAFMEPRIGTAVFGINLPLMAASIQRTRIKDGINFNINVPLTEIMIDGLYEAAQVGALNSLGDWANGVDTDYYDYSAPFMLEDINRYGKEAASDIRDFMANYRGGSVGNMVDQMVFGVTDRSRMSPSLQDYRSPNMQWVGLYLDQSYFKNIEKLNNTFGLDLDLEGVKRSSRGYMTSSFVRNTLAVAPKEFKDVLEKTFK